MAGIIAGLLPFVLKIVEFFLDKAKVDAATKQAFFEWVKLAGKDLGSVKLMDYGDKQLKWLKDHPWVETK